MSKKYNPKQTVEKILTAAEELFLTKGFDKTGMQDIVNALGMSKGAIFHHFKSKEDIFEAILTKAANQQMVEINLWLKELAGLNAKEKLEVLFNRSLSANNKVAFITALRVNDPKIIIGMMRSAINVSAPILAGLIRDGVTDGSIQTEFPDECAEVMLLLLNIWCDPFIFECDIKGLEKRLHFLQYLAESIGADVISDEHIAKNLELTKKIYEVENGN